MGQLNINLAAGDINAAHAGIALFDLSDGDDHLWAGPELSPASGAYKEVEEGEGLNLFIPYLWPNTSFIVAESN